MRNGRNVIRTGLTLLIADVFKLRVEVGVVEIVQTDWATMDLAHLAGRERTLERNCPE